MILEEHDLVPRVTRPTACLPLLSDRPIGVGESLSIPKRPQVYAFQGTHLLIHPDDAARFQIDDLRVGNRSQTIQSGAIPGLRFACDLRGDVIMKPGERERGVMIDIEILSHRVDLAPFTWDMERAMTAMDIVLVVTNTSSEASSFRGWILGCAYREDRPEPRLAAADLLQLIDSAAV